MSKRRAYLFETLDRTNVPGVTTAEPVVLAIAGVRFSLVTSCERLRGYWKHYFAGYLSPGPVQAEIFAEPKADAVEGLWEDPDPEFDSRGDLVVQRDFAARQFSGAGGPVKIVAYLSPEEWGDSTHNLLRWALPGVFLRANCFLMHSASVVYDDKAFVFFGQSGAGKSTSVALIAQAYPQASILGDDAGIIGMEEGQAWLHSAPLGSGYSRLPPPRHKKLLNGLFLLQQDTYHAVEAIPAGEAVRSVLASAMTSDFSRDVEERFNLAVKFAQSPCGVRRLCFTKDARFWPLLSGQREFTYNESPGGGSHVIGKRL